MTAAHSAPKAPTLNTSTPKAPASPNVPTAAISMQATIKAIAAPPKPGSVPYKDAVIAIHLADVKVPTGKTQNEAKASTEALVFVWGMRNNKWTPEAALKPGQKVTLLVRPWDEVFEQYGGYNRIELNDDRLFDLDAYWGELARPTPPKP